MGKKKTKSPKKSKNSKKDKRNKKGKSEKPDIKKGKGIKRKGKKGKKEAINTSPSVPTPSINAQPQKSPPPRPPNQNSYVAPKIKETDEDLANKYPGILDEGRQMAVVGSECGSYQSLCKLLHAGFGVAGRVFVMTPWANFVVIKAEKSTKPLFYLYDGCSCNVNRFRYLDLCSGTAGFVHFQSTHDVVSYIIESRQKHIRMQHIKKSVVDDICKEFCEYGPKYGGGLNCSKNNYYKL